MASQIAFERVPIPPRQIHVCGAGRCIEPAELQPQAFSVLGLDAGLWARAERTGGRAGLKDTWAWL
jgi:hypothetical protein